jgi:hypothetical protein
MGLVFEPNTPSSYQVLMIFHRSRTVVESYLLSLSFDRFHNLTTGGSSYTAFKWAMDMLEEVILLSPEGTEFIFTVLNPRLYRAYVSRLPRRFILRQGEGRELIVSGLKS